MKAPFRFQFGELAPDSTWAVHEKSCLEADPWNVDRRLRNTGFPSPNEGCPLMRRVDPSCATREGDTVFPTTTFYLFISPNNMGYKTSGPQTNIMADVNGWHVLNCHWSAVDSEAEIVPSSLVVVAGPARYAWQTVHMRTDGLQGSPRSFRRSRRTAKSSLPFPLHIM